MKLISPVLLTFIAACALAFSQDESAGTSAETSVSATAARILGNIPDGAPAPPAEPKPEYRVAKSDVLQTTTHEHGGRTITIQQIKPIDLPPPPPPAEPATAEQDGEFSQRVADYHEAHPTNELLFLGATVFRSKDSPPRTLVRWWSQGSKGTITFWSSADFALIAGAINNFEDTAGDSHAMLMGWGNVDIDRMSDLKAAKGLEYDAPEMPAFPAGNAAFEIVGDQPAAEELVVIQSLHDVYNNNVAELETAYEGREQARIERAAYLKANPPQPQDITLNYWRIGGGAPVKGAAQ